MTNILQNTSAAKILTSDSLDAINIIIQIETALADKDHAIALGIKNCIDSGTPAIKIIKEIKEMSRDNYKVMANMLGETLLVTIINFK